MAYQTPRSERPNAAHANDGDRRDNYNPSYAGCGRTMSRLDGPIDATVRLSTHFHWSAHKSPLSSVDVWSAVGWSDFVDARST